MYNKKAIFVHLLYIFATPTLQNPYAMTAIEELESMYQDASRERVLIAVQSCTILHIVAQIVTSRCGYTGNGYKWLKITNL